MRRKWLKLSLAMALTGCSSGELKTVTKPTCNSVDWFEIGRRDGISGLTPQKLVNPNLNCAASEPDPEAYRLGREMGLLDFCNVKNALMLGRAGTPYGQVCPDGSSKSFLETYNRGLEIFELAKKNERLAAEISGVRRALSDPNTPKPSRQVLALRLDTLEGQRLKNSKQISRLESQGRTPESAQ